MFLVVVTNIDTVLVTPDANEEGNIELSLNTSGGAKDTSLNVYSRFSRII